MSIYSADALKSVRNRFALLLAEARPNFAAVEFGRLLRLQGRGDLWLLKGAVSSRPVVTPDHVGEQIDRLREALKQGEFPRQHMERLCRDYELLFGDPLGSNRP